ncbi:MAG: hypothetical protein WAZ94_01670 [Phycisphaerales bacterium]
MPAPADLQLRVRKMYARVLSTWAMDLMSLRRAGLDRPVRRATAADLPTPSYRFTGARAGRWAASHDGSLLSWRTRHAA